MRKLFVLGALFAAGCGSAASVAGSDEQSLSNNAAATRGALKAIAANPGAARAHGEDRFQVRDVISDADGTQHVRLDRTHRGLRVVGGDLVVHGAERGAAAKGFSNALAKTLDIDRNPAISAGEAARIGAQQLAGVATSDPTAELVAYARNGVQALAWEVIAEGIAGEESPTELHAIVDARSGRILETWDGIETSAASGTGVGFFNGAVSLTTDLSGSTYALRDPSRGNQYTTDMGNKQRGNGALFTDADNAWGDGTLANRQTTGVDAQFGTAMTWDYYKNVHGRNGIANDGVGAFNRVHYGRSYNNAFWSDSCFCMTYGDGDGTSFYPFDSIDIAGHEMSHGVTSRTAKLVYSGESGGLNEANSDIFGTMVEFFAAETAGSTDVPDYRIGERIYVAGGGRAIRIMWKPSADGVSADCWYPNVGALDVHYSSGVANHFFYLLAEGSAPNAFASAGSPVCQPGDTRVATGTASPALAGIGRAAAEKIWYRALTTYMVSNTNYAAARAATLKAATDLFGAGSAAANAVAAAWTACSVN